MTFRLYIDTDGAAFEAPAWEVARILRKIADDCEAWGTLPTHYQTIHDANGNDCGRYAHKGD